MIRFYLRLLLCLTTFTGYLHELSAATGDPNLKKIGIEFSEVLKYTDAEMWSEADKAVNALNNSVAFDIVQWLKLRSGVRSFSQYESFLMVNADWPGMNVLRMQGEKAIDKSVNAERILNYFSSREPFTAKGSLILAEILVFNGKNHEAQKVIKQSWLEHSYSSSELDKATK